MDPVAWGDDPNDPDDLADPDVCAIVGVAQCRPGVEGCDPPGMTAGSDLPCFPGCLRPIYDDGGACVGPPCFPPVCGDGYRCWDEECDDGNTEPGDGCDENCEVEGIPMDW